MTEKTNGLLVILNGPKHGGIARDSFDSSIVKSFFTPEIAANIASITGKRPCSSTNKNTWRAANTWCNSSGSLPSGVTPRVVRTNDFLGEMYLDNLIRENTNKGLSKSVAGRIVYCTGEQYIESGLRDLPETFGYYEIIDCPQKSKVVGVFAAPGFQSITTDLAVLLGEQITKIRRAYDPVSVRSCVESFVSKNLGTKLGSGGLYYVPSGHEEEARSLRELFKDPNGPLWSFGFEKIGSDAVEHWGGQILESLEKGFEDISKLKAEKGKRKESAIGKLQAWKKQLLNAKHLLDTLPGAVDKLQEQWKDKLAELQTVSTVSAPVSVPVLPESIIENSPETAETDQSYMDMLGEAIINATTDDLKPEAVLQVAPVEQEKPVLSVVPTPTETKPEPTKTVVPSWGDDSSDNLLDF